METEAIKNFSNMVDSLRQFRRYELSDEKDRDLIEDVYVDPMEADGLLELCKKDNTTVLVGRKGTGKSTIFMRMQHELRKKNQIMTCYIDVKDIFDKTKRNFSSLQYLTDMSKEEAEVYSLQRQFIINFLNELIDEIEKNYQSISKKIQFTVKGVNSKKALHSLVSIKNNLENNQHLTEIELESLSSMDLSDINSSKIAGELSSEIGLSNSGVVGGTSALLSAESMASSEKKYNRVFAKIFEIDKIIEDIVKVLVELKMKRLFIILDDYSEIDQRSLRMFGALIVNALNNNSKNYIKLKISAYPGRVELGELDRQKIDIKYIDYYNLYSNEKSNERERLAVAYTNRIINKRLEVYTGKLMDYYFDTSKVSVEEYCKIIFNMSMNVVRHIGLLLLNAQETSIGTGRKITVTDLNEASKKMYKERLAPFFEELDSAHMTYDERIDIIQLKKMLEEFVEKQKFTKTQITTGEYTAVIFDTARSNPYTSHFSILQDNEKYIETLELNFFISKYSEMVTKKRENGSIYALNYGLCLNENLRWGKPEGNEHRTYFNISQFNFNKVLTEFMDTSRELRCELCSEKYNKDEAKILILHRVGCSKCSGDIKEFPILSNSEISELKRLEESDLLESHLSNFLRLVKLNGGRVSNKEMCIELSFKKQKIGHMAKALIDNDYLKKINEKYTIIHYEITDKGKAYFE